MPSEKFLQEIQISRTFLHAKQVGEKRGKILICHRNCSQGSFSNVDFPLDCFKLGLLLLIDTFRYALLKSDYETF